MTAGADDSGIVTFYSYKGGTGRSLMLANVAWVLASSGKRVLTVDWDLEAPGLHRYFEPFLTDVDLVRSDGIIDLVTAFVTQGATRYAQATPPDPDWYLPIADIRRYAVAIERKFGDDGNGRLHFVCAGRQGPSYAARVNSFNWGTFYDRFGGGAFLDAVKASMKEHYDCVLIDSRTGVSDASGICTVHMPDTLVVCFTLNNQGIEGSAAVAESVLAQRPKLRVLPVPMRLENSEKDKLELRRIYARRRFAEFVAKRADPDRYWADVEVLYVPFYAYEEILAAFSDSVDDRYSVLGAAERVASLVADERLDPLTPVESGERKRVRRAYQRRALDAAGRAAFDVFVSYDSEDGEAALKIASELRAAGLEPWLDRWQLTAGVTWHDALNAGVEAAPVAIVLVGRGVLDETTRPELGPLAGRLSDGAVRAFAVLLPGAPGTVTLPQLLSERRWIDLRGGSLDRASLEPLVDSVRGRPVDAPPPVADRAPYVGLEPFGEDAAGVFFGREAETTRLVEQLSAHRLLAVIGASGVGTTSLVNAGLIPRLRTDRDLAVIVRITVRADPFRALAAAVERQLPGEGAANGLRTDPGALAAASRLLTRKSPAGHVTWIVDDVEDLFRDSQATEFLELLAQVADDPAGPGSVLLVVRSDAYARVAAALGSRFAALFVVGALDRARMELAITGPAKVAGLEIEAGLPETILDDIGDEPGALALLQLALLALWSERAQSRLTLEAYRRFGGARGAINARAEAVYAGLRPEQQRSVRRVLLRLVQPGTDQPDTRREVAMSELALSDHAVIDLLISARLLTTGADPHGGAPRLQIAHEILIRHWARLRGWIDAERETLRVRNRLAFAAAEWEDTGRDEALLLRRPQLALALKLPVDDLSSGEGEFLAASTERARRKTRQARLLRWLVIVYTLVLAALLVLCFVA